MNSCCVPTVPHQLMVAVVGQNYGNASITKHPPGQSKRKKEAYITRACHDNNKEAYI